MPKLKDHILGRLLERDYEGDMYGNSEFTDDERNSVRIAGERLYRCKTVQINRMSWSPHQKRGLMPNRIGTLV